MNQRRREISQTDIERQWAIMAEVRANSGGKPEKPRAFVDTYGCQQNEADSETLRGMLREMGYVFTGSEAEADVILINTCAVREHAEKRVLGNLGALTHIKRAHPGQIIGVCGCMVQQPAMAEKIKKSYRHVDLVFGVHDLWRFPTLLRQVLLERGRLFSVKDDGGAVAEGLPVSRSGKPKAWLSIMSGCNNYCSYCIVPYVRGRERSRRPERILADAKQLISEGYKDITLLGQNVNSYGKDLEDWEDFSELLRKVAELDGDFLIRFMTSHPKDAGDRLFSAMAGCRNIARHIHLPFQAGSDRILRAMNRGYTRQAYLTLIDKVRRAMPDVVITSDVIVGFPGETEAEFEDTLRVIESVRFDALFTFLYSKRSGTPAAEMEDPVPMAEKKRRFSRLLAIQNAISEEKHARYVGSVQRVLVDGMSDNPQFPLNARTNGGRLVHLAGGPDLIGSFTEANITGNNMWSLFGEIL